MKRVIIIIIAFMVFACTGINNAEAKKKKTKNPDWLVNPNSVYPEAYYLVAVGEGDSRTDAENMAAGNLARIFESKVKADQTVSTRYNEIVNSKGTKSSETTDINTNVNVSSNQSLINLNFAESYTDAMGKVYVIAYMERMKTGSIYEERINEASSRIVKFIKESEQTKNYIRSYAYLNAATLFNAQVQVMMQQLEIISSSTKSMIELGYDDVELSKKLQFAADNVTFSIDIQNDQDNKIKIVLQDLFTSMGFKLSDSGLLKVKGQIDFSETDMKRDDYIFVRYDLQLQIIDDREDVIAALNEKGREGHTSYSEALARTVRKLESKIDKKLQKKVVQYFDNLVK